MFNFRTDRGREITKVLTQSNLLEFNMQALNLHYVTMTSYDDTFKGIHVVFKKNNLVNTLGEILETSNKSQIRIAETEKYPHVTFFFSGGRESAFKGEERILCPSPNVATYDLQPEMSAKDIRDAIVPKLKEGMTDFICLNFANPDMVGHTGIMEATIKACETVDSCLQEVIEAGLESDYQFIILADHGYADFMINDDGTPNTSSVLALGVAVKAKKLKLGCFPLAIILLRMASRLESSSASASSLMVSSIFAPANTSLSRVEASPPWELCASSIITA